MDRREVRREIEIFHTPGLSGLDRKGGSPRASGL